MTPKQPVAAAAGAPPVRDRFAATERKRQATLWKSKICTFFGTRSSNAAAAASPPRGFDGEGDLLLAAFSVPDEGVAAADAAEAPLACCMFSA